MSRLDGNALIFWFLEKERYGTTILDDIDLIMKQDTGDIDINSCRVLTTDEKHNTFLFSLFDTLFNGFY
ncbi:MAG: hypothetical protein CL912_09560 [Deltaproteobacteria bacterium]|nr:hypothetical protein [Deltaproteobacteria bacterium]